MKQKRRVGSLQGAVVNYPVAMGSSSAMGKVLSARYSVVAEPARFDQAYEAAFGSGTILQIESQEEK